MENRNIFYYSFSENLLIKIIGLKICPNNFFRFFTIIIPYPCFDIIDTQ